MNVIWSPLAKADYWKNIEYLEKEWSEREIIFFINEVERHINLLKNNNTYFIKTGYKDVFKVVIIKQITLFYRIKNNNIELLRFWNNYRDLSKFRLK